MLIQNQKSTDCLASYCWIQASGEMAGIYRPRTHIKRNRSDPANGGKKWKKKTLWNPLISVGVLFFRFRNGMAYVCCLMYWYLGKCSITLLGLAIYIILSYFFSLLVRGVSDCFGIKCASVMSNGNGQYTRLGLACGKKMTLTIVSWLLTI